VKAIGRQDLIATALACALGAATAHGQTDSGFYRPLTLAAADEPAGGRGGRQTKEDETKGGLSEEELAKIAQNPVANLISVPFQNNFNFGIGPNHVTQWSYAGWGSKSANSFLIQPFITYNFPHGWYLTSSPIITADWKASHDDMSVVPVGGGFGKVQKFGKLPVNIQLSAYSNAVTPKDFGADWQLRFQFVFMFPK
jgi:hypothetical protein